MRQLPYAQQAQLVFTESVDHGDIDYFTSKTWFYYAMGPEMLTAYPPASFLSWLRRPRVESMPKGIRSLGYWDTTAPAGESCGVLFFQNVPQHATKTSR